MKGGGKMKKNKKYGIGTIGVIIAAILLCVLPMSALAEKGLESGAFTDYFPEAEKASPSNAEKENIIIEEKKASPSNAERKGILPEAKKASPSNAERKELPSGAERSITPEEIEGTWTVDGITTYRFHADGSGALILPEHKYPFRYTIKSDELTLQFDSERIPDAVFIPSVTDDILILERNEETGTAEFTLERTDDLD